MRKAVNKEAAHPREWWTEPDHPERQRLLQEVINEIDNNSEDERGKPVYIKERDPLFKEYMTKIAQERKDHEARRDRIIRENKRLKDMGRPLIQIPAEYKVDKEKYRAAIQSFQDKFY